MISILKVDMKTVTLFFQILYSLMPKIEIFIKFLEAAIVLNGIPTRSAADVMPRIRKYTPDHRMSHQYWDSFKT